MTLGQMSAALSIVTSIGAFSVVPDVWFLDKLDNLNHSQLNTAIHIAQVQLTQDQHLREEETTTEAIANLRLYVEELSNNTTRIININSLEQKIGDSEDAITTVNQEISRLDRIVKGQSAAPATEETHRAMATAKSTLNSLEARLSRDNRELIRIMR
jgi:hypothetical protein